MLEIEAASLAIGIVSLLANLFLIQYLRRNDIVLKLILFSIVTDFIVSSSTIITSSQRLLQENGTTEQHRLFYYSSVPIWIFADILQLVFCLNFSLDRFVNFASPIFYVNAATVSSSSLIFVAILTGSFVFSALITYEVQKLSNFVEYNGTICSFLREGVFNVYFNILFWLCSAAFLFCMIGIILAVFRSKNKGYREVLQNSSYFLFPNTIICVIRNSALLTSYYAAYWLVADKGILLSISRLLSTCALIILQPGILYISLRWYNKHQESKKQDQSSVAEKKQQKHSTAAAIVGPALMIDVTTLSLFASPVINLNMRTKEFMEQRAERERSISFYQIVQPSNSHNFFIPETPFDDMYNDPFD